MSASPSAVSLSAAADDTGLFAWWRTADARARHAFVAASLGWMLDSFDVMLYSLVLASLIQDPTLQLSTAVAGQLGALTLLSAAAGGVVFGVLADRIGRKAALMWAVAIYSVFTAACGLVQNVTQLALFRILLGFGMGGEWATGVALVSETFPAKHRGKALAFAFANAVIIACYTLVDGRGVRVAGDALAYVMVLFVLDGLPYPALVLLTRCFPGLIDFFARRKVRQLFKGEIADRERSAGRGAG
jgi:MFS family permease